MKYPNYVNPQRQTQAGGCQLPGSWEDGDWSGCAVGTGLPSGAADGIWEPAVAVQHCERNCSLLFLKKTKENNYCFCLVKLQEEKVYRDTQEQSLGG